MDYQQATLFWIRDAQSSIDHFEKRFAKLECVENSDGIYIVGKRVEKWLQNSYNDVGLILLPHKHRLSLPIYIIHTRVRSPWCSNYNFKDMSEVSVLFPAKVYSDNGSQFTGASREMKRVLRNIDWEKICELGVVDGVQWIFQLRMPHGKMSVWKV